MINTLGAQRHKLGFARLGDNSYYRYHKTFPIYRQQVLDKESIDCLHFPGQFLMLSVNKTLLGNFCFLSISMLYRYKHSRSNDPKVQISGTMFCSDHLCLVQHHVMSADTFSPRFRRQHSFYTVFIIIIAFPSAVLFCFTYFLFYICFGCKKKKLYFLLEVCLYVFLIGFPLKILNVANK